MEEGKIGLLDPVWNNDVYLWHRFEAAAILAEKFPQEYADLREQIIFSVFDDTDVSKSYKIEAALEYAKTNPEQGYGYLKNIAAAQDTRLFDKMYIADQLSKSGHNQYVKEILEAMLTQNSVLAKDKILILEKLKGLGLIE